jgi:hypothetical protein
VDRLEQPLGNAGAFQQRAHEDEKRNGAQHVVGSDVVDLGNEESNGGVAEADEAVEERDSHEREGHRKAEEKQRQQGREHQQSRPRRVVDREPRRHHQHQKGQARADPH